MTKPSERNSPLEAKPLSEHLRPVCTSPVNCVSLGSEVDMTGRESQERASE